MPYRHSTSIRSRIVNAILALTLAFPAVAYGDPGDPLPAFDLIDLAGNRHTAGDYDGRILVLFFVGHN